MFRLFPIWTLLRFWSPFVCRSRGWLLLSGLLLSWVSPAVVQAEPELAGLHSGAVLSVDDLKERAKHAPETLGPLSIGLPNNGRLMNGVQAQESELLELVSPHFAYGTPETIEYLEKAIRHVHDQFENTPPLHLGHISSRRGGYLSPHLSHQSGRDVDLGFFYTKDRAWYRRATSKNLDRPRTWALVKALITETDVEMILIDHSVQRLLRKYAETQGEDPEWLAKIFYGRGGRGPIIRHAPGHATHLHLRF
ncbi:MAG: penicillin-insensitive murein endopeptidase, partial [Polyangiaceae bacterium]|nr:penicillin-insensitive murein endopeptidase [Polyangiaceae bacterium]